MSQHSVPGFRGACSCLGCVGCETSALRKIECHLAFQAHWPAFQISQCSFFMLNPGHALTHHVSAPLRSQVRILRSQNLRESSSAYLILERLLARRSRPHAHVAQGLKGAASKTRESQHPGALRRVPRGSEADPRIRGSSAVLGAGVRATPSGSAPAVLRADRFQSRTKSAVCSRKPRPSRS